MKVNDLTEKQKNVICSYMEDELRELVHHLYAGMGYKTFLEAYIKCCKNPDEWVRFLENEYSLTIYVEYGFIGEIVL